MKTAFTLKSKYLYLFALLVITISFSFYNLGQQPIAEFDEARNGINAIEILQSGEWMKLRYAGTPDHWNNKPPLFIWLTALSLKWFGFNLFAFRLMAALSITGAVFVCYKICRLYRSEVFSFFTCLLLIPVEGFIGQHVGRTADFDASLILLLLLAAYNFLKYIDFYFKNGLIYCGLFIGIGFLIKGPATFIFVPTFLLYSIYRNKLKKTLKSKRLYLAVGLCFLFPVLYYFTLAANNTDWKDALNRLFLNDIGERFTKSDFENTGEGAGLSFFFIFLDSHFNLWNYFFYLSLIIIGINSVKKKILFKGNNLLVFSGILWLSLALFFSLAATTHRWYLSPALPFIAITTTTGLALLKKKWVISVLVVPALIFTFSRKLYQLHHPGPTPGFIIENGSTIKSAKRLLIAGAPPRQNILLYVYLNNPNVKFISKKDYADNCSNNPETIFLSYQHNRATLKENGPCQVIYYH
ncbi:MAG: hypothetical protein GYB31_17620 [Bacteroidetes bacterium]|nr:hypothetical protein [Bacteroidota bacterium]